MNPYPDPDAVRDLGELERWATDALWEAVRNQLWADYLEAWRQGRDAPPDRPEPDAPARGCP
jgi:hypothetical protein